LTRRGTLGAWLLAAAALAAFAAGCGSGSDLGSSSRTSSSDRQLLRVTLTDKSCSPTKLAARSGPLTFVVSNAGTKRAAKVSS
jgi:hypothetical protein